MTTTPLARIIDTVRINCPGYVDGTVRLELYNTLNEFFQRTNVWLFELPLTIVPETNDYVLDTGQNVVINRLMSLGEMQRSPNLVLEYAPTNPPQFLLDANSQNGPEVNNWRFRTPQAGILLNAGVATPVLRIGFNPGPSRIWVAVLALNITDPLDADGLPVVPTWIMEKYRDILGHGVISRMMTQAGKPYSNEQGGAFHGRKFNQGVGLAREEVRAMFAYGGQRWAFPGGWTNNRARFY